MRVASVRFACYDRSCRPPTSGGTGGSSKKASGPGPEPTLAGRGQNETSREFDKRLDQYIADKNAWLARKNDPEINANRKPTAIDKLNAAYTREVESPVPFGRRIKPQSSEKTPPTAYGAGEWKEGKDGVWESKGVNKKYAIKGEQSGEWIVAHMLNSKSQLTRDEVVGVLKQGDYLQSKFPLAIRPEFVIGNFTAKLSSVAPKGCPGFTFTGPIGRQKRGIASQLGLNTLKDEIPVGNHVIYLNTEPRTLMHVRAKNALPASDWMAPSYYKSDVPGYEYITTHEFGHLRAHSKAEDPFPAMSRLNTGPAKLSPKSRYARTDGWEAHAEGFAEWVHSKGQPADPWSDMLALEMNWPKP